jgi:hypothetical protein
MNLGAAEHDDELDLDELVEAPHYPLGKALLTYAPQLRKLGLQRPDIQRLGVGTFGAAYHTDALGRRSVLKLTRDPTEATAASVLVGRKSDRVVDIYGIWALSETLDERRQLSCWYLVHRQLLEPLTGIDKDLVELIFGIFDETDASELSVPQSQREQKMIDRWRTVLRRELHGVSKRNVTSPGPAPQHLRRALMLLLQIGAAMAEMRKAGIDWEDIHSDNMMRDERGRLVIADVGFGLLLGDHDIRVPVLNDYEVERHIQAMSTT